jgi:chromosome segregation ATPase
MKDQADTQTVDLFPAKRGPGRPVTGKAKSNAERQKLYRQKAAGRVKPASLPSVSAMLDNTELGLARRQVAELMADVDRLYGRTIELQAGVKARDQELDRVAKERDEAKRLYDLRLGQWEAERGRLNARIEELQGQLVQARTEKKKRNVTKKEKGVESSPVVDARYQAFAEFLAKEP